MLATSLGGLHLIGPEPTYDIFTLLSDPAFTALLGVVLGALGSFVVTAWLVVKQRRDTHRAAVRAIFYELARNAILVENPDAPGSLSTAAYDSLAIPLYTDLPDEVANDLSSAYALIHILGPKGSSLAHAVADLQTAEASLRDYAMKRLNIRFTTTSN